MTVLYTILMANPSDNSCNLKKERCGIVDEKEKQTKNVNSIT